MRNERIKLRKYLVPGITFEPIEYLYNTPGTIIYPYNYN